MTEEENLLRGAMVDEWLEEMRQCEAHDIMQQLLELSGFRGADDPEVYPFPRISYNRETNVYVLGLFQQIGVRELAARLGIRLGSISRYYISFLDNRVQSCFIVAEKQVIAALLQKLSEQQSKPGQSVHEPDHAVHGKRYASPLCGDA